MDLKSIKQKFDFVAWISIFIWIMYLIGNQTTLQQTCKSHDSKLYLYINHDFKTVKNLNPYDNEYHCLKEIEVPTCFAGQKQIILGEKCKINEDIGGKYGYVK